VAQVRDAVAELAGAPAGPPATDTPAVG